MSEIEGIRVIDESASVAEVGVGSRVRVRAAGLKPSEITGTVTARDSTTLVVHALDEAATQWMGTRQYRDVPVAMSNITRLEVGSGQQSHAGSGALVGGGFGVAIVVGIMASCAGWCDPDANWGVGLVVVGGAGAALGAVIGSLIYSDRWVPVEPVRAAHLEPIIRPGLGPHRATQFGVAIRF